MLSLQQSIGMARMGCCAAEVVATYTQQASNKQCEIFKPASLTQAQWRCWERIRMF
jgi:hypothetical protein